MTVTADEDVVKEMHDVHVPRVDAVDGPAHGAPFLILKAHGVDHTIELNRVLKAKYSAEEQRRMLAAGHAMKGPDGEPSYPIGDRDDLANAIRAVGRGSGDHDKIRRFVARRAKDLGASGEIPENWAADGSITKAETLADAVEALDAPLIEGSAVDEDAAGVVAPTHEGDPDEVGTPAWEAVDAARARAAVAKLVWLKDLVATMRDREMAEATSSEGDPEDAEAAQDLDCVLDALDCALATVAKFAVDEQAEADALADDIAEQAEALGIAKALDQITKAGKVLSAANEAALRAAHTALTEVLGRVPQPAEAEEEPVPEETPVAKAAVTEEEALAAIHEAASKPFPKKVEKAEEAAPAAVPETPAEPEAAPVEKAGMQADELRAMLLKLVKALPDEEVRAAFKELASVTADAGEPAAAPAEAEEAPEPVADAEMPEAPAEAAAEPMPAPMPERPLPDEDEAPPVAKAEQGTQTPVPQGTDLVAVMKAAFEAAAGPLEERIAKTITDGNLSTIITDQLKPLRDALAAVEERVEKIASEPVPGPALRGHIPGTDGLVTRGQDAGPGDHLAEVRKMIADMGDPHKAAVAAGAASYAEMLNILQGGTR